MNEPARDNAEVLRLARLLRRAPEDLSFLVDVDEVDLRVFREQVTDALFDAHTGVIRRLASAAKLLPAPVLAKIGEKVFGPLLCARIAGQLEPGRATDVAKRLPVEFLTEVAIELDPRRSQRIIASIPTKTIAAVAVELAAREDWLTLGRFVGYLADEPLAAALAEVTDTQVLHTAFAVDDVSAVPTVFDLLPEARLVSLLVAASREELWPILLGFAEHLRDDQVTVLADRLSGLDDGVLDELVGVTTEFQLWDKLLPLAASLPSAEQTVLADAVRRLSAADRTIIAQHAEAAGVQDRLGAIGDALGEAAA